MQYDNDLLSKSKIYSNLKSSTLQHINHLNVITETGSTNTAISKKFRDYSYNILLAEQQSNGKGRRQKKWISPSGVNIYMSISFHVLNSNNVQLIPLITAVSVCKSVNKIGIHSCKIKWPNDIYLDNKKIGGILVESFYQSGKHRVIVVGIGLNVNMQLNEDIDQSWTSLRNHGGKIIDRNHLVSILLSELLIDYNQLNKFTISKFIKVWDNYDLLKGQEIFVLEEKSCFQAFVKGLNPDGALIVETNVSGEIIEKKIYSAEVSIKYAG
jgi:BirA family transcriptional regulator, biotin operon repressor / biotin---[acetyl-CoA-carboxylase] ligase